MVTGLQLTHLWVIFFNESIGCLVYEMVLNIDHCSPQRKVMSLNVLFCPQLEDNSNYHHEE